MITLKVNVFHKKLQAIDYLIEIYRVRKYNSIQLEMLERRKEFLFDDREVRLTYDE